MQTRIPDITAATISAAITYLFGGVDGLLQLLCFLIVFNFLTGWLVAFKDKKLDADRMFWGLVKIGVVLMVIIVAHRVDHIQPGNPPDSIRNAVMFIANGYYGQSFLRNAKRLGFPVPKWLVAAMKEFSNKGVS